MKSVIYMPASVPFGGAERRFAYLFLCLQRMNCDVYLITNQTAHQKLKQLIPELDRFENMTYSPETDLVKLGVFKKLKILQLIFFLKTTYFLWKKKVKHIHFPVNPSGYTFVMGLIAKLIGITISCSVVNSLKTKKSDLSYAQYLLWKNVLKQCSWIDFLSPSIENNMRSIFGSSQFFFKNATVSPCSFSYSADSNFSRKNNPIERSIDVLFLSRFIEGKGVDLLIDAIKILEERKVSCMFLIAGSGPLEKDIKTALENLDFVKCSVSYVENSIEALQTSKIVLSIQQYENYPSQTLLEAASCRTAVIATDVGDTRMLCNDQNSYLINGNALMLASAIEKLLKDDTLRDRLSNQLYDDVINNHSVKKFSEYFILHTTSMTNG